MASTRSNRTEINADGVIVELAKIAFANMRDYWPEPGEPVDLGRFDKDRTAAIKEITIHEFVDAAGVLHRRIYLKLHDKKTALDSLAKHLGMFEDPKVAEGTWEYRVAHMTREERLQMPAEILEYG